MFKFNYFKKYRIAGNTISILRQFQLRMNFVMLGKEKHELFCKIFVNSFKKVGQKPRKNDGFDCIFLTKSNNSEAFNGDWKSGGRCVGHKDK